MKHPYLHASILFLFVFFLNPINRVSAQFSSSPEGETATVRQKNFAWIKPTDGSRKIKGNLLYLGDEMVGFQKRYSSNEIEVPIINVEYFQFRELGKGGAAKFFGAIGGGFLGLLAGGALYYNSGGGPLAAAPLFMPLVGASVGFAMGGSAAAPLETINIYGNPAVYEQVRGELVKYTLKF
jgi:hypothetical protein